MQQSTLALIILGITIVVYAIPAVPLSVTTMFSLCAFALTGIISFSEAFSGFGNTATLLVAGMMVIGGAFFSTGLADRLGARLEKYSTRSERTFMLLIMLFAGAMSVLFNAAMVVLLFIPIIDSAVEASGGRLKRKNLYFPLSIAATYANSILTLGASSPYAMSVVLLVVTAVVSNFMSDGGTAAIVSPLALAMAQANGWNALPLIIAVAAGAKSAIATPLSVVTMTMLQGAGYRFRDYIRVAGPFNVLYALVSCVMLKIVFF